ncbi:MAG: GDYXXLXY domain-containing protein [Hyphomicrobiaceae bacterium]
MRVNTWIALVIVLLAQTGVLGWMVVERVQHLKTGREIVLNTIPVDPRSLFRGDYVILNYDISRVPRGAGETVRNGDVRYVTLEEKQPGSWSVVAVGSVVPETSGPGQIVLRGTVVNTWTGDAGATMDLHYGIESYFVPEGEGGVLETKVRGNALKVIVAVNDSGKAAIKGLILDGLVRYDEPLL